MSIIMEFTTKRRIKYESENKKKKRYAHFERVTNITRTIIIISEEGVRTLELYFEISTRTMTKNV